jgi:D-3-phosphoglycerate dehydrogenase
MKVVVTDQRFPDEDPYTDAVVDAGGTVVFGDFETESELIEECRDATVVITFKAPITRRAISEFQDARSIIRLGAGYDNVDIRAANEFGVPVSSMRGYVNEELAELAIMLMLAAARRVGEVDRDVRESAGWGSRPYITQMGGGTFGIIGMGEIGRSVVPKAQGLGMEVIATDPYVSDRLIESLGVESVPFEELMERSDCLSVHCQLTAETHHRFGQEEFERMKDDAVLVNTARGPIVDERALVEAVEAGALAGAGLDVFEVEPPDGTPALGCERIVCTPHHGAKTDETEQRCKEIAREEAVRALEGRQLQNVVNPEALKYSGEIYSPERHEWF